MVKLTVPVKFDCSRGFAVKSKFDYSRVWQGKC